MVLSLRVELASAYAAAPRQGSPVRKIVHDVSGVQRKLGHDGATTMPNYSFHCEQCGVRFEVRMSIVEHDQNRPECPRCHTEERVYGDRTPYDEALAQRW
jgi:putative FmdB family regulatory protein